MRLAALSGAGSILALVFGDEAVRAAAQIQFVHAMATLACATVMNIGGQQARWAPAFFLPGSVVFAAAGYALAAGAPPWLGGLRWAGVAMLVVGWGVLAWAAGRVDRPAQPASARGVRLRGELRLKSRSGAF